MLLLLLCAALLLQTAASLSLCMAIKRFTTGQGCFWGPQRSLSKLPGVTEAIAGYSGGSNAAPTYQSVCRGDGHAEVVHVIYDDAIVSFDELLASHIAHWRSVGALPPKDTQYSPALFLESEEELAKARAVLTPEELEAHRLGLRQSHVFYSAEQYHQNYLAKEKPRSIMLGIGVLLDVLPQLPTSAHQIGMALTCVYIVLTLGDRFLGSKVQAIVP